ncbi:SWIM zinc finger family protein [Cohnella lupini]|uniref:SWIM-type domain-containing protein n=1 Tax=Cohnella lupini TaxID=1294267 RepID=A0A3D9IA31_9BACL|nr:hypothetical protein [Cohnella lupini]RED58618.1 hypothetical protein DFP95_108145 [Cohnella lupini]
MIPTYELDDDQWNRLVQDVADHFDDVTLNRGFQYYKQNRVLKLTIPSHRYIKAIVEGSENYSVEINLDHFEACRCDCPVNVPCKHIFASVLKYAELHNRSTHALVNAKNLTATKSDNPSPAKTYGQARLLEAKKSAESAARLKEQAKYIPKMDISQWHELFEHCTERITQGSRNTQFVNDMLEAIFRIKPSLSPDINRLFILHARLFVLSKLTKQPQDQSGYAYSYLAFHTHHAASDLQEAIEKDIADGAPAAGDGVNLPYTLQTLDYLRKEMLAETNDNHYFLSHYQQVWSQWLIPPVNETVYSEEIGRLEEVAAEAGSSRTAFTLKMAKAGMYMHLSNDREAWKLLGSAKEVSGISAEYLTFFLNHLSRTEQWSRLTSWLTEIAPLLNLRRNNNIRSYSDYWEVAVQHLPDAEPQMWDTLASLLPLSRQIYEEKLLANEKWERWMDYHLSMDSDPLEFRVTDLQPIEKNAPELLLPFYHQAVERYVLHKNRDSYKSAVKMLKRLAKLYKKLKREPRWESFIDSFASRNSRLRALQEELRKGKLLE